MLKITKKQKEQLKKVGEKHNLRMMLAYGSQVSGLADNESDLDIAVIFNGNKEKIKYNFYYGELFGDLNDIFRGIEIDLLNLKKTDPLLKYEVTSNSKLLYGKPLDYYEFKAYSYRNYIDSADLFRLEDLILSKQQKLLKKKLYA